MPAIVYGKPACFHTNDTGFYFDNPSLEKIANSLLEGVGVIPKNPLARGSFRARRFIEQVHCITNYANVIFSRG
jgi:hypothetical protein